MRKISKTIIIPCYNEVNSISITLDKVKLNIDTTDNIIIVDDYSNDGTRELLKNLNDNSIQVFFHEKNYGKGMAIRTAFEKFEHLKDIIIIQDADLEYNPEDYELLLKPFFKTNADIVYGSRFIGGQRYYRIHFFWHYVANKILTTLTNFVTNLNMSDMETGYKVFKKSVIKNLKLQENSFGFEPEITIKLAKKKYVFYEVPISYAGRSYEEGKKIGLKDAFIALFCILKYSIKN